MKFNVVLLVALVSSTLLLDTCDAEIEDTTGDETHGVLCSVVRKVCEWVSEIADYICQWECGERRKREIFEESMDGNEHVIPCPALFATYDLNGDGLISPKEMALATGMDELETLNVAFPLCDTDADGFLTRKEFVNSPLLVEGIEDIQEERNEFSTELGFSKGDNKTLRANPDIPFVKSGEKITGK